MNFVLSDHIEPVARIAAKELGGSEQGMVSLQEELNLPLYLSVNAERLLVVGIFEFDGEQFFLGIPRNDLPPKQ